jgi:hypothetical protein
MIRPERWILLASRHGLGIVLSLGIFAAMLYFGNRMLNLMENQVAQLTNVVTNQTALIIAHDERAKMYISNSELRDQKLTRLLSELEGFMVRSRLR